MFTQLAEIDVKKHPLRPAQTPFLTESTAEHDPRRCEGTCTDCGGRCCAARKFQDKQGRDIPPADTWREVLQEYLEKPDDFPSEAKYQKIAPRVLMKVLYGARFVRHDLLCAVQRLACRHCSTL